MSRHVLLSDDSDDKGGGMEFRLTYEGPLFATQRDPENSQPDRRAAHKHQLRTVFHLQLKRLWEITAGLNATPRSDGGYFSYGGKAPPPTSAAALAERHSLYGFNFVPLVTFDLDLLCGIEILFLRPDKPGGVIWGGDIDNRLKTLLDALKIPDAGEDYALRQVNHGEKPFYVLLEDDKLITKVAVETDRLLEPVGDSENATDVRLVVTVRVRPYESGPHNAHFA